MSIVDIIEEQATRYVVGPSGLIYQIRRIKSSDTQGRYLSIIGLGAAAAAFERAAMGNDPEELAQALAQRARDFAAEAVADPTKLDELAGFRDAICCAAIVGVGKAQGDVPGVYRRLEELVVVDAPEPIRFVEREEDADRAASPPRLWFAALRDDDRQAVSTAVQELVSPKEEL